MKRLVVVAAAFVLAGCGTEMAENGPYDYAIPEPGAYDVDDPRRVSIPALGVSSSLVPLGMNERGQHEVPPVEQPEQAGWFQGGPEPGQPGPSIILGHVNGGGRAGVFADLNNLQPGDDIIVDDQTFRVYDVQQVPKTEFPEDVVYEHTALPELRAITCSGTFFEDQGSYSDNTIVSAVLVRD